MTTSHAPCPADFFGVKPENFANCFAYWTAQHYWPETLWAGNTVAGSFQKSSERPVYMYMTRDQFQQRFNAFYPKGLWPHQISTVGGGVIPKTKYFLDLIPVDVTSSPVPLLFTCIWKPVNGPAESEVLSVSDFTGKNQAMADGGYVLHDLCVYSEDLSGAGIRLAATWTKRPHGAFTQFVNMNHDQAKAKFNELVPKGYQITRFCGYKADDRFYYAAIYEQLAGEWYHFFDMTAAQFQAKYNELAPRQLSLRHVCHYGDLYSAVWGHIV